VRPEDVPTLVESTTAVEQVTRPRPTLERTLPLPGPETVLRSAELEQTRRTALAGIILNPFGIAISHLFEEDKLTLYVLTASFVLAWLNNVWLWYAASNERRYQPWKVTVYFVVAPVLNVGVLYGVGVFGPVLGMFVFNVYASCLAYPRRLSLLTLGGSIAPVVLLGGVITLGWISDPGPITFAPIVGAPLRAAFIVLVVVFLGMVYAQAWRTRELMVASLAERDEAVRRASTCAGSGPRRSPPRSRGANRGAGGGADARGC
jgi:hypothetical protein